MHLFGKLRKKLAQYLDKNQVEAIYQAFLFAEEAHRKQVRSSGEPYVTHPIAVAGLLADFHMDPETIMAALLHDVMEDTAIDKTEMSSKFGTAVAELVDGVSKLTQIKFESKAEAQAENFRKMLLAMVRDVRVILIKLADRLHNMRTLGSLAPEKRRRIAQETLDIYTPLASRLGMHSLRIELEDLCFEAMYPDRFVVLSRAVKRLQGNRRGVVDVIEKALKKNFDKHSLKRFIVMGRQKHLYSIYKKMRNKRLPLNEIMDMYAFRIIVSSVDDCYRALGMVHNLYKPVPERFKDYIAIPKANSYQSLHTTLFGPYGVPIEIQIRTKEMDEIANSGIAANWIYQANKSGAKFVADERTQAWLKDLLEMQKNASSSTEFMENVKIGLFPDEVYVFTPKGEIIEMPRGATVVDFAYAVHSDVGNHCVSAKVNRRYAPLHTKLVNGQTIEIVTAENAVPKGAWLDFVVTGKAKSNIRHFINRSRQVQARDLGEKLLRETLKGFDLIWDDIADDQREKALKQSSYDSWDSVFEAIGLGKLTAELLARRLAGKILQKEITEPLLPTAITGTEGMLIHYAKCCYPIPGDNIVGILNSGQGIMVHRAECNKIASNLETNENYLPLQWDPNISGEFDVEIQLETYSHRGVFAEITGAIAATGANIQDIKILDKTKHYGTIAFIVSVLNRAHLARCLRLLRNVAAVQRIYRTFEE